MAKTTRKCWLTFEGGHQNEPCLWKMAHKYPDVMFDIRQASVQKDIGIMAVLFTGEEDQVQAAIGLSHERGRESGPGRGRAAWRGERRANSSDFKQGSATGCSSRVLKCA